jgi:hypothetical protein
VRALFVIARNSSFTYKGRAVDVIRVRRELGVRYVLEGSVRKAGTQVRVSGQLIDASTGAHLWADRFDGRHFCVAAPEWRKEGGPLLLRRRRRDPESSVCDTAVCWIPGSRQRAPRNDGDKFGELLLDWAKTRECP